MTSGAGVNVTPAAVHGAGEGSKGSQLSSVSSEAPAPAPRDASRVGDDVPGGVIFTDSGNGYTDVTGRSLVHHDNGYSDSLMYWIQGGESGAAGVTDHDRAALAELYVGAR